MISQDQTWLGAVATVQARSSVRRSKLVLLLEDRFGWSKNTPPRRAELRRPPGVLGRGSVVSGGCPGRPDARPHREPAVKRQLRARSRLLRVAGDDKTWPGQPPGPHKQHEYLRARRAPRQRSSLVAFVLEGCHWDPQHLGEFFLDVDDGLGMVDEPANLMLELRDTRSQGIDRVCLPTARRAAKVPWRR